MSRGVQSIYYLPVISKKVVIIPKTGDKTAGIGIVAPLHLDTLFQAKHLDEFDRDWDVGSGSLHLGPSSPVGRECAVVDCLWHLRLSRRP